MAEVLKEVGVPYSDITCEKPSRATAFLDDRAVKVDYNRPWSNDIEAQLDAIIAEHKKEKKADLYINFTKIAELEGVK